MKLEIALGDLLAAGRAGRAARRQFYTDPIGFIERVASGMCIEERAVLFSMNRQLLCDWVPSRESQINLHHFEGHWEDQGEDWPAPPPDQFYDPARPLAASALEGRTLQPDAALLTAAGGAGTAWADPGPHGRGFLPASGRRGDPARTMHIVGEGLLDRAVVVLEHVDWTQTNAGPHPLPVTGACYANFRRCYLECQLEIDSSWPTGFYTLTIQNDPANPMTHIRAGHFFEVT